MSLYESCLVGDVGEFVLFFLDEVTFKKEKTFKKSKKEKDDVLAMEYDMSVSVAVRDRGDYCYGQWIGSIAR